MFAPFEVIDALYFRESLPLHAFGARDDGGDCGVDDEVDEPEGDDAFEL